MAGRAAVCGDYRSDEERLEFPNIKCKKKIYQHQKLDDGGIERDEEKLCGEKDLRLK